ncbi:MAG TPA: glycosyltransferase family 4 protein [Bacteroidota bacterium]|nr:glycosyltransferase family 4 protein [Bacteroidota bacterium]
MPHETATILFVSAFHAPFIQDDIELLEKHFTVRKQVGHGPGAAAKIVVKAFRCDVIFCWFASVYAFVAVTMGKILGIKSIIVIGGVDVAKDKELDYGIWLSPWRARLVRYALRNADRVLAVHPTLKDDAARLAGYDGGNIQYLPTGYGGGIWKPAGEKESIVLTVAVVKDRRRLRVKGIDVLAEAARRLPGMTFIVIGVDSHLTGNVQPPLNMHFRPVINRMELLPYYQRAKVYCLPSLREGLSNSLCEAMLCGCIPVASDAGGSRTAVGEAGILVPPGNIDSLVGGLQRAMQMRSDAGSAARARIVALFPSEKRETGLISILNGLLE